MQRQKRTVFFTGVPLFVEKAKLRKHFDSFGRTIDFRMFDPGPGKDFRSGLVEYIDERSAGEAISRLNGTAFGGRPMKVIAATTRNNNNMHGRGKRRRDLSAGPPVDAEGRELMTFPKNFRDPVLGSDDTVVLDALRQMTIEDAYEAVEQLRVLALESRQDAKVLLDDIPALRSAVVVILQHAGRLPSNTELPAEAFQASSSPTAVPAAAPASGTPTSVSKPVSVKGPSKTRPTETQTEEVIQLISKMSKEDVERILLISDSDLSKVSDLAQQQQLRELRDRLIQMSEGL